MAEWSIAAVLKTVDCNRSGGSNPSFSAKKTDNESYRFFLFPKVPKARFVVKKGSGAKVGDYVKKRFFLSNFSSPYITLKNKKISSIFVILTEEGEGSHPIYPFSNISCSNSTATKPDRADL